MRSLFEAMARPRWGLVALWTIGIASRVPGAVLFHASFEETPQPVAGSGFAVVAPDGLGYGNGRLGRGAIVPGGASPLRYEGRLQTTLARGSLSFWVGSEKVEGYEAQTLPLLTLRTKEITLRFFYGSDGYVYLVHTVSDGSPRWFRYPLYDLRTRSRGKGGKAQPTTFLACQWDGGESVLYVNAVEADPLEAPPAGIAPPEAEAGFLVAGGAATGLVYDEIVLCDTVRTPFELESLYLAYRTGRYRLPPPEVTLNEHVGEPIEVDGVLSEAEWGRAAVLGGLHMKSGRIAPYEARFFLTYDRDRLYAALRTFAAYPLRAKAGRNDPTREDPMLCMDDSLELLLMPYESVRYDYFHFLGNSEGRFADELGTVDAWDAPWEYACRVEDGVWTAEVAIPYGRLSSGDSKARYPPPGDHWRFNLSRNWTGVLEEHWCSLAHATNYGNWHAFGRMGFRPRGTVVRFERLAAEAEAVRLDLTLVNNADRSSRCLAYLNALEGVLPFAETKRDLRLDGGARQTLSLALPLKGRDRALLEWGVVDAETGEFLLRGSGRYPLAKERAEAYRREVAARAEAREDLHAPDTAPAPEGEAPKDAKPEQAATETGYTLWPTPEAVDEALDARRRWKNNDLGITAEVPPPWSPVTCEGETVRVWNRAYDFSDALFLRQARAKDRALLAAPVALVLEREGETIRYDAARTALTGLTRRRADLVAVGGDATLTVSAETWVEFDGCLWTEVKLLPRKPLRFDRLWLEIPFRTPAAPQYVYWLDKTSNASCGPVPSDGVAASYRSYVWLGDVEGGLGWWNEETREWFLPHPERTTMTHIDPPRDGVTRLRIMMATTPQRLEETMAFEFGLMATPMRPLPRNWRRYDHFRGWRMLPGSFSRWSRGRFVKEPLDPAATRKALARCAARSPYALATPNCGSYSLGPTTYHDGRRVPTAHLFLPEWSGAGGRALRAKRQIWKKPEKPGTYVVQYAGVIPTDEYTDCYLHELHALLERFPRLKGVYMDSVIPIQDNPLAGAGFTDRYGRRRPTVEIMRSRRFMQRLYAMFWAMRGDPAETPWVMYTHCSNQICPPVHAFTTSLLQGEGLQVGPRALGRHPLRSIPMAGMRVAYNSHAYGWIDHFLGYDTPQPEAKAEMAAMFLMHDHLEFPDARVAGVVRAGGLRCADEAIDFRPYWNAGGAVASLTDGGYANAYVKTEEQRVILIAASLATDRPPTRLRLRLDRDRLALPEGNLRYRDLENGQEGILAGEVMEIPLRKNDFRAFEVKSAAEVVEP